MPSFTRKARPLAAAAVAVMLLTGCGDDDDAVDAFNADAAEEMASIAAEVTTAAAETEQVQSNLMNAFGTLFGDVPLAPMTPYDVIGRLDGPSAVKASFRDMMPSLALTAPAGALIPDEFEGVTFVWDVVDAMYVPSDEAGAPANGARFVFYAVDPLTGEPAEPLNEVGHLDLVDESTADVARLLVEVVRDSDGQTLADYYLQGSVDSTATTSTVTLDSEGFVRGGDDRLDFDIHMMFSSDDVAGDDEAHTLVELETNDGSISLEHDEVLTGTTYDVAATFVIAGAGNEAEFSFESTGDSQEEAVVDGVLSWNGEDVVVFSGSEDDPDFSTPDGGELGAQEIQAVAGMWVAFAATYFFSFLHVFPFLLLMAFSGF